MDSATLTITAKGQVTLKRDLLRHLGIGPGDHITVEPAANRGAVIRAASRTGIDAFFGCLPDKGLSVSIEDMNDIIADGWSGTSGADHA